MSLSDLLTSSRLKDARACQRLHRYKFVDGYRPVAEAEELRFGTLMHLVLEAWWRSTGDRLADGLGTLAAAVCDDYDRVRVEALIRGYHARWAGEPLETVAVEVEFAAPLRNPASGQPSRTWRLGGKLDAIARHADGRLLVVEHKTSSEDIHAGSEYWRRLLMDGQVSIYFDGARALGHQPDGCLYDVIGKPGIRPKGMPLTDEQGVKIVLDAAGVRVRTKDGKKWRETADTAAGYVLQTRPETPEEFRTRLLEDIAADPNGYFARGDVVRLDAEMDEARHDIWQLGVQIREADRAARYPRNPDACVRFGKTCAFFDACTGQASLDDPTRFRKVDVVHPELGGGDAAQP